MATFHQRHHFLDAFRRATRNEDATMAAAWDGVLSPHGGSEPAPLSTSPTLSPATHHDPPRQALPCWWMPATLSASLPRRILANTHRQFPPPHRAYQSQRNHAALHSPSSSPAFLIVPYLHLQRQRSRAGRAPATRRGGCTQLRVSWRERRHDAAVSRAGRRPTLLLCGHCSRPNSLCSHARC